MVTDDMLKMGAKEMNKYQKLLKNHYLEFNKSLKSKTKKQPNIYCEKSYKN